jgi:hypothetical protein
MFVASAIIGIVPGKRFGKRINILLDIYATLLALVIVLGASWNLYGKTGNWYLRLGGQLKCLLYPSHDFMLQKIENVLKEFVMGALWTQVQQPGANVIKKIVRNLINFVIS